MLEKILEDCYSTFEGQRDPLYMYDSGTQTGNKSMFGYSFSMATGEVGMYSIA